MAYFDCIVGGSGKGNTLVVTCADDLAGATITCTNGTKTYTKTCPSTAPYEVTFYGLAAGTWTVSATVSGNTYTTTVVITDYEAELGGFSWRAWVDLSKNYTSSDFTDLDDLLSDETAIRELMSIHACVDYLAGIAAESADVETIIGNNLCAKWINNRDYALDTLYANTIIKGYMDTADKYFYGELALMPQVPTMTSNTAPYGEVIYSQQDNTYKPYYAFDGNDSTFAAIANSGVKYLGYKFITPVCINRIYMYSDYTDKTYDVEYSDDNSTWEKVTSITQTGNKDFFDIENNESHLYWRISGINVGSMDMHTLQFYAWQPKGNIPIMTSDTTPYGQVTYINQYNSGENAAWNVLRDYQTSVDCWGATNGTGAGGWWAYKFVNPVCVRKILMKCCDPARQMKTFTLHGSNDGTNYTQIGGIYDTEFVSGNFMEKEFNIDNDNYYLYYKLVTVAIMSGSVATGIGRLKLFGRELSVSVPKMDTNTTPYGEVIYSTTFPYGDSAAPYKPFNGGYTVTGNVANDIKAGWYTISATDQWLGYDFMKATKIKMVAFKQIVDSSHNVHSVNSYKIQYSDDNSTWEDVGTSATSVTSMTINALLMEDNIEADAHRYWRMKIESGGDSMHLNVGLAYIQFYGLDYSEKEFEAGTTKKWLYDHGVELETIENTALVGTLVKGADSMNLTNPSSGIGRISTSNAIDVTSYSLERMKIGKIATLYRDSVACTLALSGAKDTFSNKGYIDSLKALLPNNVGLDISSVNESVYPWIYNSNIAGTWEITEWWLE